MWRLGLSVQDLGFRVWGLGQGVGSRVQNLGHVGEV